MENFVKIVIFGFTVIFYEKGRKKWKIVNMGREMTVFRLHRNQKLLFWLTAF